MTKPTLRITRFHLTDLECAALNDKACKPILDKLKEDYELIIDEQPVPGVFYHDMSINFMYPHVIDFAIPAEEHSIMIHDNSAAELVKERIRNMTSFTMMQSLYPDAFKDTFDRVLEMASAEFKLHDFGDRGEETKTRPSESYGSFGFHSKETHNDV